MNLRRDFGFDNSLTYPVKNIVRTNFRQEWAKLYKISFMAEILIKKSKYLFHSLLDENVSFFVSQKFQNEWNAMLQSFGKIQKT